MSKCHIVENNISRLNYVIARDFGTNRIDEAAKAQASRHICADSPEPSLRAYTKYGCI